MRGTVAIIAVLGALLCACVGNASAQGPEFGDRCTASEARPGATALVFSNGEPSLGLSPVVPPGFGEPPGVITRWHVSAPAGMPPTVQSLVVAKAIELNGMLMETVKIGESGPATVVGGGPNEFATRIPVPTYGLIGLAGPDGALVCGDAPRHVLGIGTANWASGEVPVVLENEGGVPVTATVEPDRDRDGYGDETQDGCLEQPLVHTACPFVRLRPTATPMRTGVLLEVSTGDPTRVEVSGQVGWSVPRRHGKPRTVVVGLGVEPTASQEVGGATVGFWLPLPQRVRTRLSKMPPKQKLKAEVTVVATDVIGHQTVRKMTVRLPGHLKRAA
jgi:hypothetical protein